MEFSKELPSSGYKYSAGSLVKALAVPKTCSFGGSSVAADYSKTIRKIFAISNTYY